MKRYDLMHSINGRGTFLMSQACIPHLLESKEDGRVPHILNNSPVRSKYLLKRQYIKIVLAAGHASKVVWDVDCIHNCQVQYVDVRIRNV